MAFAFHSQIFAIYIRTDAFRGILFISNDVVQNGSSFYATQMTNGKQCSCFHVTAQYTLFRPVSIDGFFIVCVETVVAAGNAYMVLEILFFCRFHAVQHQLCIRNSREHGVNICFGCAIITNCTVDDDDVADFYLRL